MRPARSCGPAAMHVFEEVRSLHELHREEERAGFRLNELVQSHQVSVVNIRQRPELPLESVDRVRVETQQGLQGDGPAGVAIDRLVDDPHPSFADLVDDGVAIGPRPGRGFGER